ncbi:MAG: DUF4230 domain-containing protein, partial [Bacteroidota bacterium]
FNSLVRDFNLSMLHHVANRMNLSDSLKLLIEGAYEEHHPYLRQLYFNDFVSIRDTSANLYEAWYSNEGGGAVEVFNEVAAKYTCFLVNHVIMSLVEAEDGILNVKGRKIDTPCGIAMTEALRPLIKRLQDRAAIQDFAKSRGMMEEKVEKVIAELATVEVRDKKGLSKQLQTKIWGFSVSSTDIEVTAISNLKMGFKLDTYFDIKLNSKSKWVTVTLPAPVILSHEVYPKIDKLDIGWLREVKTIDLNKNFNLLRAEFRRDALNSDIRSRAKKQAEELITMLFQPVIAGLNEDYKLRVRFKENRPSAAIGDGLDQSRSNKSSKSEGQDLEEAKIPF